MLGRVARLGRLVLVLVLAGVDTAPLTAENARWNVNLEERHVPEAYRGGWTNHSYFPSPEDWRSLSIYQLITDRFADGDPSNNELRYGGFDVRDMTFRHGGDFRGLTEKLQYIKGLGCRGIWISPVFQNGYNSYHQYSQLDFTLLDQRLGTKEELRRLTEQAHALGLYVIVDVVMNHMSNEFFFEGHKEGRAPWRMHETVQGREYLLLTRKPMEELHSTPAGRQPYMDFWYNNTWDPQAQYPGTLYGQHGEATVDVGHGTYESSDFHHNGDLQDYYDPFQIHYGKLYGTMDDLRLEHRRVQQKYLAMSNALISSCDVDGFRVDTPMQVPLVFYKAWVPAVKSHAKGLGKKSFGIFGEFYVTPERYSTMTGRGKDHAMYGTDQFIEGPQTMKGGIVYSYYWYMFTAFIYGKPQYADGFGLAYAEEQNMLDTYDEVAGQKRYAMWNFCNNHDNWRMQSMTSTQHLFVCLVIITFWPGIPLHYAGDEQNFRTPGSALDGWAREELSPSLAWQAVRHQDNFLQRDSFDMTSRNYLFIARLNALRSLYFQNFGSSVCDDLKMPQEHLLDVVAFIRGCRQEDEVLVIANFHAKERRRAELFSHWAQGVVLQDSVERTNPWNLTVGAEGHVLMMVPPMNAFVFAPAPLRRLPPIVQSVTPRHGARLTGAMPGALVALQVHFDRPMRPDTARRVALDGQAGLFSCLDESCAKVAAAVPHERWCNGLHSIEVPEGVEDLHGAKMASGFRSSFIVDHHEGIVARPELHERPGLICDRGQKLCHNAAGARWLRIRDVTGNWTQWRPYEAQSEWRAVSGVGVLVQYHAEGSSSYIAGDCLIRTLLRCHSSWHHRMHLRGEFNSWGDEPDWPMRLVDHFTWGANFTADTFLKVKFAPGTGWSQSYGIHPTRKLLYGLPMFDPRSKDFEVEPYRSGAEASRRWMLERGFWSSHESMATSADFAADIWISYLCTPEPPPCPPPAEGEDGWQCHSYRKGENLDWCASVGTVGCVSYALQNFSSEMTSCGQCDCCWRPVIQIPTAEPQTCCILFNDLLLNYTITPDLSRCRAAEVQLAPSWVLTSSSIYEGQTPGRCEDSSAAGSEQEVREVVEDEHDVACASTENDSWITVVATVGWAFLWVVLLLCHSWSRLYLSVVREASPERCRPQARNESHVVVPEEPKRHVLLASIEHHVPERHINAFTGETGAFLQDFIQEHPAGSLSLVHPMLNMDYGHLELYSELAVVVDGKIQTVEVFFLDSQDPIEHDVRWYFLRHELFSDRTQESLFPQPMSKIRALRFYSLWNQALAMLLEALKPDVYHCLDSHQALAPLYMEKQIPMVLLLRDPWTMVSVDSDFIGDRFWKTVSQMRRMSLVFNLKIHTIRRYCLFEGRFNLMSAGVRYISETQRGRGLCVLSVPTARQLRREHRLLQWRPLEALEHPGGRDPDEAEVLDLDALKRQKDQARRALQQHAGLAEADAKVLLFVGPWAHHAGVELLAEVVPQILSRHEQAQVILCGLCSDLSGVMAQDALCRVMPSFRGRLCFLSERYLLPEELRGGVDFLLAPFLSEPVGHTDVELGVPTIGCAAGALGRTPGVYFHQQNSLAPEMLKSGFFGALDFALNMPDEDYWNLAEAAHHARSFQAEQWRPDLSQVYDEVQRVFQGRRSDDQEPFDDRLWNNAASQEDLQSAIAPRRSSSLRPVSSTADLAHQMQVLDIDDDAEFLTQPVSESRAQEIMKAVAESLPYFSDHMDAGDLQRDISQARQRLQERNHMTRGLMKPFLRGLCLRIHLVMAICYVTSSVGELLLQTIEVEGEGRAPFGELWLAFYGGASLGGLFWLALSYGIPPNLLMTASQALSLMAFLLLPMLPEHLYEADWSYLSYAAMSGVQSSSKLLFILWNFNEENEHGFQVAIWRLALLEALRRSVSWLALVATYAGKLWIYKQVLFVVSFTSLVLLFKAPYCYATHVLPSTSGALGPSVWFLLLSEICNSLGSYGQDVRNWLALNGWTGEEIQLMILVVIGALPLLLHPSFSWLRRQQVWGPWPLRDFACLLPSGTLLRSVAIFESRGQSRSHTFVAALLFSVLVDAARYAAIASSLMTVMGSRWNALKGCYLASSLIAMAAAMSPWLLQCITEKLGLVSLEDGDADLLELGRSTFWATAPLALLGYVFQASTVFFFEKEVLTFKGPGCWSDGSKAPGLRWLWVAQVRQHMRAAKAKLGQLQERLQAEELDLDQVQAVIEESFAANLPSLLISPKGVGKQIWDTPKNEVRPMQEPEEEEDLPVADEHKGVFSPRDESSPVMNEDKANWEPRGLPAKDALASKSVVSFKTELPPSVEESQEDKDATTTVSIPSFDVTPMAPHDVPPQDEGGGGIDPSAEAEDSDSASSVPAERSSSELQEDSGKGLKLEEEVPSEVLSQEPELASVASLEEEQRSTSLVEEEPETEQTPGVREP